MEIFLLLLIKLLPLYLYIVFGYLAGKFLKIRNDFISSFLLYILIPLVIFGSTATTPFTSHTLAIPFLFFLICCLASLIVYFISGYFWKDATKNMLAFIAGTANTGYLGFALVGSLFGAKELPIAILAVLGTTLYFNSIGFLLAAKGKHTIKESIIKLLKLPILYAFVLGLVVNVSNMHLNRIFLQIVNDSNQLYIILGMMTIGLSLAEIKKYTFDWKFIGISLGAKFILWPLLMVAILMIDTYLFHIYHTTNHHVLIVLALLPVAVNLVPYATYLKESSDKAAVVVMISTFFALFYIPLIISLFLH